MFETLVDVISATLVLIRELAVETPWAVPLVLALWAGLAWVSVRKGRELGGFLTLLAGVFLFFAIWNHPAFGFWQRRELNLGYLYVALAVVVVVYLPSLLLNLLVHFTLRAKRGVGLGHSELRPDTGRPVVGTTKPPEDEEVYPVPVREQRAALAQAMDRDEGEAGAQEQAPAGQPGTLLVADLARSCLVGGPEDATVCVEAFGNLLADAAADAGGRLLQSVDTALVYRFFSAASAVACAQDALARLDDYNARHPGMDLAIRLGAHTGLVLQSEGKVKGRDAAVAAALMVTSPPGGLQVSGATHEVLPESDQDRFEPLGVKTLKGLPDPLDIWRLKPAEPEEND